MPVQQQQLTSQQDVREGWGLAALVEALQRRHALLSSVLPVVTLRTSPFNLESVLCGSLLVIWGTKRLLFLLLALWWHAA